MAQFIYISNNLGKKKTSAASHPLFSNRDHLFPSTAQSPSTVFVICDIVYTLCTWDFPQNSLLSFKRVLKHTRRALIVLQINMSKCFHTWFHITYTRNMKDPLSKYHLALGHKNSKTAIKAIDNSFFTVHPQNFFLEMKQASQLFISEESYVPFTKVWSNISLLIFLSFVFCLFVRFLFFLLETTEMVIYSWCTDNLNLAPTLLANCFLVAWDRQLAHATMVRTTIFMPIHNNKLKLTCFNIHIYFWE